VVQEMGRTSLFQMKMLSYRRRLEEHYIFINVRAVEEELLVEKDCQTRNLIR